ETLDREVASMHFDYRGRSWCDCPAIVVVVGAICGPNLDELGTAARHDVRNAKAATDLDQLSPRDQNFLPLRNCVEGEHHRRRAVVDDERVLRARQLAQQTHTVRIARSTLSCLDVVLEV